MSKKAFSSTKKSFSKKRAKNIWLAIKELTNINKGYVYIWKVKESIEKRNYLIASKKYENRLEMRKLLIDESSYQQLMRKSSYLEDLLIEIIWEEAELTYLEPDRLLKLKFNGIGIDYDHYKAYKKSKREVCFNNANSRYWYIGKTKSIVHQ